MLIKIKFYCEFEYKEMVCLLIFLIFYFERDMLFIKELVFNCKDRVWFEDIKFYIVFNKLILLNL